MWTFLMEKKKNDNRMPMFRISIHLTCVGGKTQRKSYPDIR